MTKELTTTRDSLGRPLRDLRISLIDRCNFRCTYCMPRHIFGANHVFLPQERLLSVDSIARAARAFVSLGARKIRLTGGEPLLRREIIEITERLSAIRGVEDLALTTNGMRLATLAEALRKAGMRRINVSLDALDPTVFRAMSGGFGSPAKVIEGIAAAQASGLTVKVNTVIRRDINEGEIEPIASYFKEMGIPVRFIEFMDTGNHSGWRRDLTVPAAEIVSRISRQHPIEPLPPLYPGEVARRYRYIGQMTEVGFITSITEPFCSACGRARISADGKLYTCLFSQSGHDIRSLLESGASDEWIAGQIARLWSTRSDRYSELRKISTFLTKKVEMSFIGG